MNEFIEEDLLDLEVNVNEIKLVETPEEDPVPNQVSSGESIDAENEILEVEISAQEIETEVEIDPIFAELSKPILPELEKENRAQLQMQSPNRLYFYWSIQNNPFQTLQKVLGENIGNYQLVAKLINLTNEREEIYAVDPEGNWWFNVEANSNYRAEIGFYAPNRPFIRVIYSNEIETPRKNPSPRVANDADWAVSANTFAEVLDNSGFSLDAFQVALAGDNFQNAENAANKALHQLIGERPTDFTGDEIRFSLLALASGVKLEKLRGQISEALYGVLKENEEKLSVENSMSALAEHFEIFDEEFFEEAETDARIFGASLLNFPKKLKKRAVPKNISPKDTQWILSKLSPLSSYSYSASPFTGEN